MGSAGQDNVMHLTVDIVSAFVSNNQVIPAKLMTLIGDVHQALTKAPAAIAENAQKPLVPAVPIKKSVTPDYIVSLEDGKRFKSLKRHLRQAHNLTPDEYRTRWGLPRDYPMVAPNYAKTRSQLAKNMGLGTKSATSAYARKGSKRKKSA
jgi:predicted transcriptional regulator